HGVADVVVAGDVEERHFQLGNPAVELLPALVDLVDVVAALDQVADGDDEFGLEDVQLIDRLLEHTGPRPAGAVGDDGEAESLGVVVEFEVVPGVDRLLLDLQVGGGTAAAGRRRPRQQKDDDNDVDHNQAGKQ